MTKRLFVWLLCISLLIGVTACGTNGTEVTEPEKENSVLSGDTDFSGTTVTMMLSQANYKDAYQQIMDEIEADTGIKVDLQLLPDDQYFDAVNVKLSTGEVPDIMMNTIPSHYVSVNASENFVVLSDQPWVERMVNASSVMNEEGNIYGMPIESIGSTMGVAYNKEILKQAGYENPDPQTWDEFIAILEAIKENCPDVTPLFMSNADSWTTQVFMTTGLSVALGDKGVETYNKLNNNEIKLADVPEFKTVLEEFRSLYDNGYVNVDNLSATYDMGNEAIATGKAAIYIIPDYGAQVMASLGDPDNIGIFVIPYGDNVAMATSNALTGYMVPKNAKNKEAALEVLNLMSQPKYLNIFFAENPGNPAFDDVDGGEVLGCITEAVEKYVAAGLTYVEMNSQMSDFSSVQTEWWNYYVELAAGAKTVDEVIAAVDAKNADYMKALGREGW